ncbi:hypothetical protein [Mycobacterium asiaticum]|nr:hypothetical protein [Mycobacterium asiaticum]
MLMKGAMKNYGHQISDIADIRGTLDIVRQLNIDGLDAIDSGVLGTAAARRGVYGFAEFRGIPFDQIPPEDLEARLELEREKPSTDQGTRAFARDARRLLRDMDWIDPTSEEVTAEGDAFLSSEPGSAEERAMLAEGLLRIALTDDAGRTSHPARVMLSLLAVGPSYRRQGLELALEARDDSPEELNRVTALYEMEPAERQAALGINNTTRANAVKIFPRLAVTAGLVYEDAGHNFSLTDDGRLVLDLPPGEVPQPIRLRARVTTSPGRRVTAQTIAADVPAALPRFLSRAEQEEARARLGERKSKHQQLVRNFFIWALGDSDQGELHENSLGQDAVWLPPVELVSYLFEMKTVDDDAPKQARAALAQLAYYDYFIVSPCWPDRALVKCAVFDADIGPELSTFLDHNGVAAIAFTETGATALNPRGQEVLAALPRAQGA